MELRVQASVAPAIPPPPQPHPTHTPRCGPAPSTLQAGRCVSVSEAAPRGPGAATLVRPLASASGIAAASLTNRERMRGSERVQGEEVPRRARLHVSPPNWGRGVADSVANLGEPLPCLGPLARVVQRLTFPGSRASRPRLRPPPAFLPARRRQGQGAPGLPAQHHPPLPAPSQP